MSREAVESLIDRWVNDPSFRVALRADPEGAVRRSGVEVDQEELAALLAVDWNVSDEELHGRLSHGM